MKSRQEYQNFKNLVDKALRTMRPIQVDKMPEVHELGMAFHDLLKIQIYNHYEDIETKNFEKRMQQLITQLEYEKALREMREAECDDDILGILFTIGKIAAIAAVAYFAPAALSAACPTLLSAGTVAHTVATGVTIGATDAATQGVGIKLHLQNHFSLQEVLESTISGGINKAAAELGLAARAAAVAGAAAGTQGLEIAVGMRNHFDAKAAGTQIAALLLASGVSKIQPQLIKKLGEESAQVASKAMNTALDAVLDKAINNKPINVANLTASVIGNIVGEKLGKFVADKIHEERQAKSSVEKREEKSEELDKQSQELEKSKSGKSNSTEKMLKSLSAQGSATTRKGYNPVSNDEMEWTPESRPDLLDPPLIPKICPWGINIENIPNILKNYDDYEAYYNDLPPKEALASEFKRVLELPPADRAEYNELLWLGKNAYYHSVLEPLIKGQEMSSVAEHILAEVNIVPDKPTPKYTPIDYNRFIETLTGKPPPSVLNMPPQKLKMAIASIGEAIIDVLPYTPIGVAPRVAGTTINAAIKLARLNRFFGNKTTKGALSGEEGAAKVGNPRIEKMTKDMEEFLGKDFKMFKNKSGDPIFISSDGTRKIRFDVMNPHGYEPHGHIEIFKDGKWIDYIPGQHHIYLSPQVKPDLLPPTMKK